MSRRRIPTARAGAALAAAPPPLAVVLALVALVGAAGCGGDDADQQLSAEQLISRGDEICAEFRNRFEQVQRSSPNDAAAAAVQTGKLVEIGTDELDELRALDPPDKLRRPYDRYLVALGRALGLLQRGREAAEAEAPKAYSEAQAKANATQPKRQKLARAVGFRECSKR